MAKGGERLFELHAKSIYRLCYSFLGNAEDALQATYEKLLVRPVDFESDDHAKAWLIVCAQNTCRDMLKSAHRKRSAPCDDETILGQEDRADHAAEVDESADCVMRAVVALPEKYKTCVYLHYYEGRTSAEIGEMLDVSASAVRNRLAEARKMLLERLEAEGYVG